MTISSVIGGSSGVAGVAAGAAAGVTGAAGAVAVAAAARSTGRSSSAIAATARAAARGARLSPPSVSWGVDLGQAGRADADDEHAASANTSNPRRIPER